MRYTRRFWYGVRCALLVQWGTPYCRRWYDSPCQAACAKSNSSKARAIMSVKEMS